MAWWKSVYCHVFQLCKLFSMFYSASCEDCIQALPGVHTKTFKGMILIQMGSGVRNNLTNQFIARSRLYDCYKNVHINILRLLNITVTGQCLSIPTWSKYYGMDEHMWTQYIHTHTPHDQITCLCFYCPLYGTNSFPWLASLQPSAV